MHSNSTTSTQPFKACFKCKLSFPLDHFSKNASACKPCAKQISAEWRAANPDKIKAREIATREKRLVQKRDYHQRNRDRMNERARQYNSEHKDTISEYQRLWYQANKDEYIAKVRAYQMANPEIGRGHDRRRRAQEKSNGLHDLTTAQWEAIKATYKHRCAYCGTKSKTLHMDHVAPLSRGGGHTASNVVPACRKCNLTKGVREAPTYQRMLA